MAILTELNTLSDILKWEDGESVLYARETITLITGQNLAAGTVLGKISVGAATSAAKSGGNTGNGTLTMDGTTPVQAGAKAGIYTVRFTVAATNNGTFVVRDPDGFVIGEVVMAAGAGAFADDIKFAVADGSTDFSVGDGFDITVAAGSYKYTQLSLTAGDGSGNAAGILLFPTNATSADTVTVAATRDCTVPDNKVIWPVGISAAQKTTALNQLNRMGIILRVGV